MRLMAIRQARLEPLALSASSHERRVNGWAAASGEEPIDFSAGIAWFGDILNIEGPLLEIGTRSVFVNSAVGVRQQLCVAKVIDVKFTIPDQVC